MNFIVINDVPIKGEFGKLVALIDLEKGNYIVEYTPWEDSGVFIWGLSMQGVLPLLLAKILPVAIPFYILLAAFIILFVRYRRYKSA